MKFSSRTHSNMVTHFEQRCEKLILKSSFLESDVLDSKRPAAESGVKQ
jgi:hypothetical protein